MNYQRGVRGDLYPCNITLITMCSFHFNMLSCQKEYIRETITLHYQYSTRLRIKCWKETSNPLTYQSLFNAYFLNNVNMLLPNY